MEVQITKATREDAPVLRRLGELYAHDFSSITGAELGPDGRYDHDFFKGCDGALRTAYLVRVDGALAGFAIVARGSRVADEQDVWDMAEFFIVRRWRRHGIGSKVAAVLFGRHPGRWEVRERFGNTAAHRFWRSAIGQFTGGCFDELQVDDERWKGWIQRFDA